MELKFNDAKSVRPGHLERCLCYDKFLNGYRCYVYDNISKYWCTQATTEHDPDGENHIVDYADFQVTEWASLSNVNKSSLPSNLDEAAEEYAYNNWEDNDYHTGASEGLPFDAIGHTEKCFKAGVEWMAGQGVSFKDEVIFCGSTPFLKDADFDILEARESFKDGDKVIVQIRKKQ